MWFRQSQGHWHLELAEQDRTLTLSLISQAPPQGGGREGGLSGSISHPQAVSHWAGGWAAELEK